MNHFINLIIIIFSLPYFVRLKQCATELLKTSGKDRKGMHVLNSIKYLLLLTSSYLMHSLQNSKAIVIGHSLAAFSVILASYWDIFIDWGLGQKRNRSVGPIVYAVCLLNILLRLSSMSFFSKLIFSTLALSNGSEVLRRILWVHLRLTNHLLEREHIQTPIDQFI